MRYGAIYMPPADLGRWQPSLEPMTEWVTDGEGGVPCFPADDADYYYPDQYVDELCSLDEDEEEAAECPDCDEDAPEVLDVPQVRCSLPPIDFGTPRQIEVATRIREQFVTGVNISIRLLAGCDDLGFLYKHSVPWESITRDEAVAVVGRIEGLVQGPSGADANFWLDKYKRRPHLAASDAVGSMLEGMRGA